jgi:hypothetical protein
MCKSMFNNQKTEMQCVSRCSITKKPKCNVLIDFLKTKNNKKTEM